MERWTGKIIYMGLCKYSVMLIYFCFHKYIWRDMKSLKYTFISSLTNTKSRFIANTLCQLGYCQYKLACFSPILPTLRHIKE